MSEERKMYPELSADLTQLSAEEIQRPMTEIPAGYSSFGPMKEWEDWYHYLLPHVLPRAHKGSILASLVETLITGYIALYPNGVHVAPYKTFREDTLRTLGLCMMEPKCWNGRQIVVGEILHRSNANPRGVWRWWDASGDFSASMFFCLKYLPLDLLGGWMRSVLAIPSPHWRAQLIVWAVGAHGMLEGRVGWPSQWNQNASPAVSWDWSHCLRPELASGDASGISPMTALLPEASRGDALHLLRSYFTEDVFLEWLESIGTVEYLRVELGEIPSAFERLFVRNAPA